MPNIRTDNQDNSDSLFDRSSKSNCTPTDSIGTNEAHTSERTRQREGFLRPVLSQDYQTPTPNGTRGFYTVCVLIVLWSVYQFVCRLSLEQAKEEHRAKVEKAIKAQKTTERNTLKDAFFDYPRNNNATHSAPHYDPENREMQANKAVWVNN